MIAPPSFHLFLPYKMYQNVHSPASSNTLIAAAWIPPCHGRVHQTPSRPKPTPGDPKAHTSSFPPESGISSLKSTGDRENVWKCSITACQNVSKWKTKDTQNMAYSFHHYAAGTFADQMDCFWSLLIANILYVIPTKRCCLVRLLVLFCI